GVWFSMTTTNTLRLAAGPEQAPRTSTATGPRHSHLMSGAARLTAMRSASSAPGSTWTSSGPPPEADQPLQLDQRQRHLRPAGGRNRDHEQTAQTRDNQRRRRVRV